MKFLSAPVAGWITSTLVAFMQTIQRALEYARDVYTRRSEGVSIWVVASKDITASQESDCESFYDPLDDKPYRHASMYEMPEGVDSL